MIFFYFNLWIYLTGTTSYRARRPTTNVRTSTRSRPSRSLRSPLRGYGSRSRAGIKAVRIAHKQTILHTTHLECNILVLLALRLSESELDILALDKILILRWLAPKRREMREDILILVRTITNRNEPKSRLAVKPLDTSGNTFAAHYTLTRWLPLYIFRYIYFE
jgi:hypothetical protein